MSSLLAAVKTPELSQALVGEIRSGEPASPGVRACDCGRASGRDDKKRASKVAFDLADDVVDASGKEAGNAGLHRGASAALNRTQTPAGQQPGKHGSTGGQAIQAHLYSGQYGTAGKDAFPQNNVDRGRSAEVEDDEVPPRESSQRSDRGANAVRTEVAPPVTES